MLGLCTAAQGTSLPEIRTELPTPLSRDDFHETRAADVAVGRLLFFDPVLSGNRNISCATCHHPELGTSDGLSLGIGEGGLGLGPERHGGTGRDRVMKRIPRNASALFNLGARELHTLFHDGRLSLGDQYENGFDSPAEEWLPDGLDNILAAQALFPLVAQFEMAGNLNENEIIGAVHDRIDAAWPLLAKRVSAIDDYAAHFIEHETDVDSPGDIEIQHIANALGAFINAEWQRIDTPFDRYLRGEHEALTAEQKAGMSHFYGKAACSECHSGPWLSDQEFHALGLPAYGPGRTRRHNLLARDLGRQADSDDIADAYAFRTPMLRNVELTAPYGHNGAYASLEGIIRHHLDPYKMRASWQPEMAKLPEIPWLAATDFQIMEDRLEMARQAQLVPTKKRVLSDEEIAQLVDFLGALTDHGSTPTDIPDAVPSGLPIDRFEEFPPDHPSNFAQSTTRRTTP